MHDVDDINSILEAVNKINSKLPKKSKNTLITQNFVPKLNQELRISPDVDRLIQEAEKHKQNVSFELRQVDLTQNKNNLKEKKYDETFDNIQAQIVDDLYSKFTKRFKKNTLKVIFNLRLEIKNLENKLENYEKQKIPTHKKKPLLKSEQLLINTEEKLRFQIIDLEQDKTILLQKVKKFDELNDYKNNIIITKEKLKSIYEQIKKQKIIFIDLTSYSKKIERDSFVFKESYEKLVIENSEIKKRLVIAKEQITTHEKNKLDLIQSINQLNEILSKENIISNITPLKLPLVEDTFRKNKKTET
jgi:hypothetical protein